MSSNIRYLTAVAVVILILLASGLGYLFLLEDDSPPPAPTLAVEITGEVVDSQAVQYMVFTNQPTYTVRLSPEVFPVDETGVLRPLSNWTYPGTFTTPSFLVPPGRASMDLTVSAGPLSWNRTLNVTTGDNPVVSGQRAFEKIDLLTTDYNGRHCGRADRDSYGARYLAAARAMRDLMLEWGFDHAEVTEYNGSDSDDLQNVVGYKWGRLYPDEWLVFGGHFDVAYAGTPPSGGTWEGASDDTSGSTVSLELAEGIATRTWDRTVVAALWACEEEGLLGSREFVANLPDNVTVKTYWNFDMVALNYPIQGTTADPFELGIQMGPDNGSEVDHPVMLDYVQRTVYDILGYEDDPLAPISFSEGDSCSSDHCAFAREGYPAYNFHSPGGDASFVQEWHSGSDTLDTLVAKARSEQALASGFNTLVWITFYLLIFLDNDDQVGRDMAG